MKTISTARLRWNGLLLAAAVRSCRLLEHTGWRRRPGTCVLATAAPVLRLLTTATPSQNCAARSRHGVNQTCSLTDVTHHEGALGMGRIAQERAERRRDLKCGNSTTTSCVRMDAEIQPACAMGGDVGRQRGKPAMKHGCPCWVDGEHGGYSAARRWTLAADVERLAPPAGRADVAFVDPP